MKINEREITKLIKAGNLLIKSAREYSIKNHQKDDIYKMADLILVDYRKWKESVIKFLKQNKVDKITIINIDSSDTLFINPTHWAMKAIGHETKTEAFKLYIENVNKIINELSAVYLSQKNKNTIDKLDIDKISFNFNEDESVIIFKDKKIKVPIHSKESVFCKNLFEMKVGSSVSWDIFYNNMDEEEESPDAKNKKSLRDAMNRINKRLSEYFKKGSKLAKFENKNIIRLH